MLNEEYGQNVVFPGATSAVVDKPSNTDNRIFIEVTCWIIFFLDIVKKVGKRFIWWRIIVSTFWMMMSIPKKCIICRPSAFMLLFPQDLLVPLNIQLPWLTYLLIIWHVLRNRPNDYLLLLFISQLSNSSFQFVSSEGRVWTKHHECTENTNTQRRNTRNDCRKRLSM